MDKFRHSLLIEIKKNLYSKSILIQDPLEKECQKEYLIINN